MLPTKIVVIGAGSASFGLNTLASLLRSKRLCGSRLALVDRNKESLAAVMLLAERLNREWGSNMTITAHAHYGDPAEDGSYPLEGAEFVVLSIEVQPREKLWRSDYELPLSHGVRQPYAENGGPGGFAHAARNIGPVMEIAHAMQKACPEAWLINFTNPMMRICDAVARYSQIKVVGLCHQIQAGYAMVGRALAEDLDIRVGEGFTGTHSSPEVNPVRRLVSQQAMQKVDILAAGLNHFTWMLALHDRRSGADLYPQFASRWNALDPAFEPLTRKVYAAFGKFPIPGDEHLCEYLPWASDPLTEPWIKYDLSLYDWDVWDNLRGEGLDEIARIGGGHGDLTSLRDSDSEGAVEMIENIAGAGEHYHQAVNLPNRGYISNLPDGAIVEVPGVVNGSGVHGVGIGALPEPIAELCRREITTTHLCVDSAVNGDRGAALQCLLLDPVITDLDVAQAVLDDYLEAYRLYLPQFWA